MAIVVIALAICIIAGVGLLLLVLDPNHRKLKVENSDLRYQVDKLKQEIAKKDKELEVRRLGLPWVDTE